MFTQTAPSMFLLSNIAGILAPPPNGVNDTTALQGALNSIPPASAVILQPGVYLVNASLLYPGNCSIFGPGVEECIIRVLPATNLTTPILASKDWFNNATTSGFPVHMSGFSLDGNSAMSGAGGHGLVSMNFWSSFDDLAITNVSGDGFLFTRQNQAGTNISNTCVEPKIRRLQIRNPGQSGIHVQDNGVGNNACTDGFIIDCIIANVGARAINHDMGPGWLISGNHTYGSVTDGILIGNCFATRVVNNYIDGYGSGSSSFISGISMGLSSGARQSVCMGNTVNFDTGTASGTYQAIRISGPATGNNTAHVMGNFVNGGNQTGSLGYVFQATSAHAWTINAHDNVVTGAQSGNGFFIDANTTVQTFQSGNTFASAASATAVALATAGTIATAGIGVSRVAPAAAVTGIILQAGTIPDQEITVINEAAAANTVTFNTAPATSLVADSATLSAIAGLSARKFTWDSSTSLWYPAQ